MVAFFIAIVAAIYFYQEARKRDVSAMKWSLLALAAFLGPYVAATILANVLMLMLHTHPDIFQLYGFIIGISSWIIGVYLLIVVRKKLFKIKPLVEDKEKIVIKSLDIVANADGSFTVADKTFDSEKEASSYVSFLSGLPR